MQVNMEEAVANTLSHWLQILSAENNVEVHNPSNMQVNLEEAVANTLSHWLQILSAENNFEVHNPSNTSHALNLHVWLHSYRSILRYSLYKKMHQLVCIRKMQ
jgi:type II secretory pathway component PulM